MVPDTLPQPPQLIDQPHRGLRGRRDRRSYGTASCRRGRAVPWRFRARSTRASRLRGPLGHSRRVRRARGVASSSVQARGSRRVGHYTDRRRSTCRRLGASRWWRRQAPIQSSTEAP